VKPRRKRRGALIAIILLSLALASAIGGLVYFYLTLDAANSRIDDQDRQIQEQSDLIDQKETFGAAMEQLLDTTAKFDGVLVGTVVPMDDYELLASRGWAHRWDAGKLASDTADVQTASQELEAVLTDAHTEATTNSTGTTNEAVVDSLGAGFALSALDDADTLCLKDVLGCVTWEDPFTVHFDAADYALPYMTDWLRTGLAYHEFAHVLQMTNPEQTDIAVEAFGGDIETMADCYALTYLDGWTLDNRVWVSSYMYWDVSMGYGHVCDGTERQAVIDWYESLGFESRPISQ
jgi:hypothetical protein